MNATAQLLFKDGCSPGENFKRGYGMITRLIKESAMLRVMHCMGGRTLVSFAKQKASSIPQEVLQRILVCPSCTPAVTHFPGHLPLCCCAHVRQESRMVTFAPCHVNQFAASKSICTAWPNWGACSWAWLCRPLPSSQTLRLPRSGTSGINACARCSTSNARSSSWSRLSSPQSSRLCSNQGRWPTARCSPQVGFFLAAGWSSPSVIFLFGDAQMLRIACWPLPWG